ncbi:MAG: (2Fe-2S)-binding protein, partial [Actinobacteria bacterium]|nr:(2Fe-2S)-binding protein [Actinomycetota bacterium]
MRLPPQPNELIDRSSRVIFTFDGLHYGGHPGDTIGSALYANGQRIFSRSFKYHRPRGLLCCSGHCPNCLMTVDGVPNVRVCVEPIRQDAVVESQNVLGSLNRDLLSATDKFGGPFTPVGFYYRTMIRPRRMWPLYEKVLRNLAGLGKVGGATGHARRYDTEHRRARVLVVGGGRAGRAAATEAAAEGSGVVLVDEDARHAGVQLEGVEVLAPARALGIWEGNLVPVDCGTVLYRYRAERIVVATGALEQPLIFPGNDLVGVLLPSAVRRLVRDFAIKPGSQAVVLAADERELGVADDLREAGVEVSRVVDLREMPLSRIEADSHKGRVWGVRLDGRGTRCDLLVVSSGRQPAYSLLAQAGAHVQYEPERGIFVPGDLPETIEAVGSVTGDGCHTVHPYRAPQGKGHDKSFVCICEDVTTKDVSRAVAEGFDSI